MLFCTDPEIERWSPDFSSSGSSNPTWTRIRSSGVELCNSIEWTEWLGNPVQVQICDCCGTVGCASGGYIHLSSIENCVLWTMPQNVASDDLASGRYCPAAALARVGSVAFRNETWSSLRNVAAEVPEPSNIARANGRALADAWVIGPGRPNCIDELVPMLRQRLLAADTLTIGAAIGWIEHWVDWFNQRTDCAIDGVFRGPDAIGARIETFDFDGPAAEDWPALAQTGNAYVPAFNRSHVFHPGPGAA